MSEAIVYPNMPLAVYREIAAHLQQVQGVRVLLTPQTSQTFDYQASQIEALQIEYTSDFQPGDKVKVEAILDYYAQRHGRYQPIK
jgi:hypothetical protein